MHCYHLYKKPLHIVAAFEQYIMQTGQRTLRLLQLLGIDERQP